jgi:hypothetical protein
MKGQTMSFKPEVQVAGESSWSGNGLRFAVEEQAKEYARDLMCRWTSVRDWRVVTSDDVVNAVWEAGRLA